MKRTSKCIMSTMLAATMVFSSMSWNALASAAPETSGVPDAVEAQDLEVVDNVEAASNEEPLQLKLDDGSITLNVGSDGLTYTQGGVTQSYSGVVTITQSNANQQLTNTITINDVSEGGTGVEDPTAYINLADINTKGEFKIADNCKRNVVVTLMNGTENTLASGLVKNGDETSGTLTIQAEDGATEEIWGSLTATGTAFAAGIGGGYTASASNIAISGGDVIAVGGSGGAGIGGGNQGHGSSNITITGGKVNAYGVFNGAGIGGGSAGNGGDITISGGTVTATGGYNGAGIGGGYQGDASNITISGGTVTAVGGHGDGIDADGIGGGYLGSSEKIYISGGSVNASSIKRQPDVSAEDETSAYLTKLTFKNGEAPISNTAVLGLTATSYNIQPFAYGLNDVVTDENGVFYAYLPVATVITGATVDGIEGELKPETDIVTITGGTSGTLYVSTNIAVNPAVEELFR